MPIQNFHLNLISCYTGPSFLLGSEQDMSIQLYGTILLPTPSPPPLPTSPPPQTMTHLKAEG